MNCVWKTKDEIQEVRNDYETRLPKLSSLEPFMHENQAERRDCIGSGQQFQAARPSAETREVEGNLTQVILQLKSQIERLTAENNSLSEQVKESKNLRAELETWNK